MNFNWNEWKLVKCWAFYQGNLIIFFHVSPWSLALSDIPRKQKGLALSIREKITTIVCFDIFPVSLSALSCYKLMVTNFLALWIRWVAWSRSMSWIGLCAASAQTWTPGLGLVLPLHDPVHLIQPSGTWFSSCKGSPWVLKFVSRAAMPLFPNHQIFTLVGSPMSQMTQCQGPNWAQFWRDQNQAIHLQSFRGGEEVIYFLWFFCWSLEPLEKGDSWALCMSYKIINTIKISIHFHQKIMANYAFSAIYITWRM